MKLLLTKDVRGLGRAGDVKDVSDGHARNFLIPKGFALPATTTILTRVQKEEQEKQDKFKREQEHLAQLKNKLADKEFTVKAKGSGSNLFAALHQRNIAAAINAKHPSSVTEDMVVLDKALKTLGEHEVGLKLNDQIKFKIRLIIQAL